MNKLITALATPYRNGKVDAYCYEKLLDFQLKNGVSALLAVGTTAEAQLLDECEKKLLVKLAKGMATNTPVYAGVEGRSTSDAVREVRAMEQAGADGLMIAPPSFAKCTPQGYLLHIQEIRKATSLPLILYNAPSRCGYVLDSQIISQLADTAMYLKDAGNDLSYTSLLSKKISVLCGNDGILAKSLKHGAVGVISVVSNVEPQLTRKVLDDVATDSENERFRELARLSMLEVSPIAVKYMLYKRGIFDSYDMRLPLTPASKQTRKEIDKLI